MFRTMSREDAEIALNSARNEVSRLRYYFEEVRKEKGAAVWLDVLEAGVIELEGIMGVGR